MSPWAIMAIIAIASVVIGAAMERLVDEIKWRAREPERQREMEARLAHLRREALLRSEWRRWSDLPVAECHVEEERS